MDIEKRIVASLQNIKMPSNITPILSDRGGVEPSTPYLLINIVSTTNIGLPRKSISHTELSQTEEVYQTKEFLVSLTFHASAKDNTHDWVQKFYTGLQSDMYGYIFSFNGLGFVSCNNIYYQPQPVDGVNYKRAILDLTFRAEVIDSFDIFQIKDVSLEGDLLGSGTNAITVNKKV